MPAPDGSCRIRTHDSWMCVQNLRECPAHVQICYSWDEMAWLHHIYGDIGGILLMAYYRSYWSHLGHIVNYNVVSKISLMPHILQETNCTTCISGTS